MSKKITETEQEVMVQAYLSGLSAEAAAALVGRSNDACWTALRKQGIAGRKRGEAMQLKLPSALLEKGCSLYAEGGSLAAVGSLWECDPTTASHYLRKQGIRVRRAGERSRKYAIDETYFDKIDTEEKAYWLGFLTADGYCGRWKLMVGLKRDDKDHLVRLATALQSDYPIRDFVSSTGGLACKLEIFSVKLGTSLLAYGFGHLKTERIIPWQGSKRLLCHYWRGVFDGDGHVSRPHGQRKIFLCGNHQICQGFADFIGEMTGCRRSVHPYRSIWEIHYCRIAEIKAVAKLLYDDASIYLPRKKERADWLIACNIRGRKRRKDST